MSRYFEGITDVQWAIDACRRLDGKKTRENGEIERQSDGVKYVAPGGRRNAFQGARQGRLGPDNGKAEHAAMFG